MARRLILTTLLAVAGIGLCVLYWQSAPSHAQEAEEETPSRYRFVDVDIDVLQKAIAESLGKVVVVRGDDFEDIVRIVFPKDIPYDKIEQFTSVDAVLRVADLLGETREDGIARILSMFDRGIIRVSEKVVAIGTLEELATEAHMTDIDALEKAGEWEFVATSYHCRHWSSEDILENLKPAEKGSCQIYALGKDLIVLRGPIKLVKRFAAELAANDQPYGIKRLDIPANVDTDLFLTATKDVEGIRGALNAEKRVYIYRAPQGQEERLLNVLNTIVNELRED